MWMRKGITLEQNRLGEVRKKGSVQGVERWLGYHLINRALNPLTHHIVVSFLKTDLIILRGHLSQSAVRVTQQISKRRASLRNLRTQTNTQTSLSVQFLALKIMLDHQVPNRATFSSSNLPSPMVVVSGWSHHSANQICEVVSDGQLKKEGTPSVMQEPAFSSSE